MNSQSLKIRFVAINEVWRYGNIGMDQLTGYLRCKGFHVETNYFGKKSTIDTIISKLDLTCDVYGFSVTTANYKRCSGVISEIKAKKKIQYAFGEAGWSHGIIMKFFRKIQI